MHFYWPLVIFILLYSTNISSAQEHWNYHGEGPDVWPELDPGCAGKFQSPINIKTSCTIPRSFAPFRLSPGYNVTQDFLFLNTGHGIRAVPLNASTYPLTVSGGGLNGTYWLANFHMHWGENYNSGSEHQINGKKYAGEVHFAHQNAEMDHFAILGIFIQSNRSTHSNNSEDIHKIMKREVVNTTTTNETDLVLINSWETYFQTASRLLYMDDAVIVKLNPSILLPKNLTDFYRYEGSTTVPPCIEAATWSVFKTPIYVDNMFLELFRTKVLPENYRPVLPLYGRAVYRSFKNDTSSLIPDYNVCENKSTNLAIFPFVFLMTIINFCFIY